MLIHQIVPLPTHNPHVLCVRAETQPAKAACVLLHGFPDTNWGWRKLLKPLAKAGYDVYAPSMRGYGPTDREAFSRVSDFEMKKICSDVEALLDALLIDRCVVVGHDWGGTVAWSFAVHFPKRVLAVCSFCTPYNHPNPQSNPWEKMKKHGMEGRFAYQMVFQTDHAVELLEEDLDRTLRVMQRGVEDVELSESDAMFQAEIFSGFQPENRPAPSAPTPNKLLSAADVQMYKSQFTKSGFLNPVRWYRNVEANWKWNCEWFEQQPKGFKLTLPSLMITAENDSILTPSMAQSMVPYFSNLEIHNVSQSTHWILQEQPEECVRLLTTWFERVLEKSSRL